MPCFRCGARQTDPVRGASPWKRGVLDDGQVLICPACQRSHDWTVELDRCGSCGSVTLICRLGDVECRDCGHVREAVREAVREVVGESPEGEESSAPGLSEEVAAALSRVLGRS